MYLLITLSVFTLPFSPLPPDSGSGLNLIAGMSNTCVYNILPGDCLVTENWSFNNTVRSYILEDVKNNKKKELVWKEAALPIAVTVGSGLLVYTLYRARGR